MADQAGYDKTSDWTIVLCCLLALIAQCVTWVRKPKDDLLILVLEIFVALVLLGLFSVHGYRLFRKN